MALHHAEAHGRADRYHSMLLQRSAYRVWLITVQHRVQLKDERLTQIEQRAIVLGHKRVLRFWLFKWKEHQADRQTEKRASGDHHTRDGVTATCAFLASFPSPHSPECPGVPLTVDREELKQETWKKVNGWLSSYRAVNPHDNHTPQIHLHSSSRAP